MGMPNTIKVGALEYTVEVNGDMARAAEAYGLTNHPELRIVMASPDRQPVHESKLRLAMLHEVLHAIANVWLWGHDFSEEVIEHWAHGMFQVLTDNPELVAYLLPEQWVNGNSDS